MINKVSSFWYRDEMKSYKNKIKQTICSKLSNDDEHSVLWQNKQQSNQSKNVSEKLPVIANQNLKENFSFLRK